jgi:hypothetical protein
MATGFPPMPTDAQSNLVEIDRECRDQGSHDTHGGTTQTLMAQAAAQPNHPSSRSSSTQLSPPTWSQRFMF